MDNFRLKSICKDCGDEIEFVDPYWRHTKTTPRHIAIPTELKIIKKSDGCPYPDCKSTEIEGKFVEIQENGASQECYCNKCQRSWIDHYKFDHVDFLD